MSPARRPVSRWSTTRTRPDAIENVLQALRPSTPGRLVVVVGAGGDRDRHKRPKMGEVAGTDR